MYCFLKIIKFETNKKDELKFLRVRSQNNEIMVAPGYKLLEFNKLNKIFR